MVWRLVSTGTTGIGGCCRVGNIDQGGSSNRSEHAAAALALENSLTTDKNIILLTDSKLEMPSGLNPAMNWRRMQPNDPQIPRRQHPSRYHRKRVERGLLTLFAKIHAHRGKFFNEMADPWADQGVLATDNVR